jgi:hypothetical protein
MEAGDPAARAATPAGEIALLRAAQAPPSAGPESTDPLAATSAARNGALPPPRPRLWRRGLFAVTAAGALALLATQDPASSPYYLPCGFHLLTGWWCPGCGSTRALHALVHGDLGAALRFNGPVTVGLLAAPAVLWLARRRPRLRSLLLAPTTLALLTAAMLLFGILRNLPYPPFSAMAPGG